MSTSLAMHRLQLVKTPSMEFPARLRPTSVSLPQDLAINQRGRGLLLFEPRTLEQYQLLPPGQQLAPLHMVKAFLMPPSQAARQVLVKQMLQAALPLLI